MVFNQQKYSGGKFPCFCYRRIAAPRGAVLVVMLISITLLVGLVFFVYNYGDQVNTRLDMQNTADAVAISGAGWIARSMNVVAMNNTGQSKLLSLVVTLDSLPLATDMSLTEVAALKEVLTGQLARLQGKNLGNVKLKSMIVSGLESLERRLEAERIILQTMDEQFKSNSFDMSSVTHWPDGELWKAISALDAFSEATLLSAGIFAQDISADIGRANYAETGFVIPIVPEIPYREGDFIDYQPTLQGQLTVTTSNASNFSATGGLGGVIPDWSYPYRLGPWAKQHRWWWSVYEGGQRVRRPGSRVRGASSTGGAGTSAVTQNAGWEWNPPRRRIGYTPYGFYQWALWKINVWAEGNVWVEGNVPDTSFYSHVKNIGKIKLDYMFGSRPVAMQSVHYPQFIIDYPTIRDKMSKPDPSVEVYRTHFFVVEVVSTLPPNDPGWLGAGVSRNNAADPLTQKLSGWRDPETWSGFSLVSNYVWRKDSQYEVTEDTGIGLLPQREDPDDPGSPLVWHTVYLTQFYIFAGADIGTTTEVSNPCGYDNLADLPGPFLLDTKPEDYTTNRDEGIRRDQFTYLGVAARRRVSRIWPQRFATGNPGNIIATVAQAEVFNNKSWDLWTQNWQAKLVPVNNWTDWVNKLDDGIDNVDRAGGGLDTRELNPQTIHDYLNSLDAEFAETFLNH